MSIKPHGTRSGQTDTGADDFSSFGPNAPFENFTTQIQSFVTSFATAAPSASPSPTPAPAFDLFSVVSATMPAAAPVSNPAVTTTKSVPTTSVVTTTVSSVPSWVKSLSTAAIAADMAAADVNGTVSYTGLAKLFSDLDTTLTKTNTKLTAAEFNDLKTIAANLNNGMSTSSYLTGITQALVNGNAANATWTGGAANAVALGNLATGSSATQLSELIGKWFLGTDLPSSKVILGNTSFSVSYSTSSKPLFASSGPSMNDINQGYLGDCYLLASLAEAAKQDPSAITSMFTSNGNGTYGVRFYVNGTARYVTVNASLANGGNIFNSGADLWASLAEKGYAELQATGVVTGNSVNFGNSWTTIGNGGAPEMALEEITGASAITDFRASGSSWGKVVYNSSFGVSGYTAGNSTASVLSSLVSDLAVGDDVVLSSWTNAKDSAGKTTLVASHAMSIYGYDAATGMLQVRNPWGTMSGQYWDTTFEVSLSTLLAAGDTISVDNVGLGAKTATTSGTSGTTAGGLKATADTNGLSAMASGFIQAIASLSGGGSANASFAQAAGVHQQTLASPLA
jgi:Calpain family cysteine protease